MHGSTAEKLTQDITEKFLKPFKAEFDGQQEGEGVLYKFVPHSIAFWTSITKLSIGAAAIFGVAWLTAQVIPARFELINQVKFTLIAVYLLVGIWWLRKYYREAITYITERRVVRFEPVFPCFHKKRMLFWANVIKSKAVSYNILARLCKIGGVQIFPVYGEGEDIKLDYVYYYEDLTNFVDKILFVSKHKPTELGDLRPFVPMPKGERY
ncbi:MAG: hypothetical protein SGJ02_02975 [bacterium]|nr:hypothetical protein [bacterium]